MEHAPSLQLSQNFPNSTSYVNLRLAPPAASNRASAILNDIMFLKISKIAIACSPTPIRRIGVGFEVEYL
jgi:hypothetical protein